jgi:hypothetical protein
MRAMNFNYKAAVGKRENINQVIKDCFITKKCGVRKHSNTHVSIPGGGANAQGANFKGLNKGLIGDK